MLMTPIARAAFLKQLRVTSRPNLGNPPTRAPLRPPLT